MRVVIPDNFRNINIGHQEENEAVEVLFNVEGWAELYGAGGEYLVIHQRPNDPAGYPIEVAYADNVVTWVLTAADMAYAGYGRAELVYKVNGVVAKSDVYNTLIEKGVNSGETPPDPWTPWVDEVIEARDEAVAAAEAADQSASDAEAAKDAIEAMTASGSVDNTTGTPAVVVTKTIVPGDPEHVNLDFHFSGMKGEPGTGDMEKSAYDPDGSVEQAGGIPGYVAGEIAGKADTATVNAALDLKADKVAGAVAGDFAALDANGNLTDSGISPSDLELVKEVSNDPANSSFDIAIQDAQAAPVLGAVLKGKTVAINQLVKNGNFADTSAWNKNGSAIVSTSDGVMTIDMANGTAANRIYQAVSIVSGHIYLLRAMIWADEDMSAGLELSTEANGTLSANNISISASKAEYALIATAGGTEQCFAIGVKTSFYVRKNLYVSNAGLIDLTLCGFTASETTDVATLKAAWLKKYGVPMPQSLPYNAGSILSNNATYQLTGKNLFDESGATFTDGQRYDYTTGGTVSATNYATCDTYLKVKPNTKYAYGYNKNNGTYSAVAVLYYDESKAFISGEEIIPSNSHVERQTATFTTPANCAYVRFHCAKVKDGIQIEQGNTATTFEPFYDGGSIQGDDLNGFDGTGVFDTQSLTERRRMCGKVNLGSLNWSLNAGSQFYASYAGDGKIDTTNGIVSNGKYTVGTGGYNGVDKSLTVKYALLWIVDSDYTTGAALKAALSDVYLVYELATPTSETVTGASLETKAGYNLLRPVSGDLQSGEVSMTYVKSSYLAKLIAWIRSIL